MVQPSDHRLHLGQSHLIYLMRWDVVLHIDPHTSEPTSTLVLCYRRIRKVKKRIVNVASESSGTLNCDSRVIDRIPSPHPSSQSLPRSTPSTSSLQRWKRAGKVSDPMAILMASPHHSPSALWPPSVKCQAIFIRSRAVLNAGKRLCSLQRWQYSSAMTRKWFC